MRLRQELDSISKKLDALVAQLEDVATPPRLLTMARAARCLGVGGTKFAELIRTRAIRTVMLGSRRMVPLSELIRVTTIPAGPSTRPGPDCDALTGRTGAEELRRRMARI